MLRFCITLYPTDANHAIQSIQSLKGKQLDCVYNITADVTKLTDKHGIKQ